VERVLNNVIGVRSGTINGYIVISCGSDGSARQEEGSMRPLFIQTLVSLLVTGLVLAITGSSLFAVAVLTGAAPKFDQQIMLDDRYILVIHSGPSPTCWFIPNPPQHDCFWPGSARPAFSVDYLTPHGAQSLIWLQLPE
jgi:hypothetical protein